MSQVSRECWVVDLGLLAEPGGVDEHCADGLAVGAFQLEFDVDGVARGARDVADDHAVLADEAVHEGGLADVRAAEDGDLQDVRGELGVGGLDAGERVVQDVLDAALVQAGDGVDVLEPERVEIVGEEGVRMVVRLVRDEVDGLAAGAEPVGDAVVERKQARLDVHDEQDGGGVLDGGGDLLGDELVPLADRIRLVLEHAESAGVDEVEAAALPDAGRAHAVAGHAAVEMHDRLAASEDGVEEGGFSDVGASHDGEGGQLHVRAGVDEGRGHGFGVVAAGLSARSGLLDAFAFHGDLLSTCGNKKRRGKWFAAPCGRMTRGRIPFRRRDARARCRGLYVRPPFVMKRGQGPQIGFEPDQAFIAWATATATSTDAPTIGLLPMPMSPIISTCAGTEEEPANWASECMRPMVSVMP